MRTSEIVPDHDDEGNEMDYREDRGFTLRPDCRACGKSVWLWDAYRYGADYFCGRLCVPAFIRMMSVTRSTLWGLLFLLLFSVANATELPPCHPMMGPGTACIMPTLPPPGGVLQAAPPSTCGATTPAGTVCVWPNVEVRPIEVVGTSYANPSEPIYRHTALLLLPHSPLEVPLFVESSVINYQRNMQDARFCGTGNEHRYYEAGFWFESDSCPPVEQ
jgi:hypothetical protein